MCDRGAFRRLLRESLDESADAELPRAHIELEEICYEDHGEGDDYVIVVGSLCRLLRAEDGERTYADLLSAGEISPRELVDLAAIDGDGEAQTSPREIQRALFQLVLSKEPRITKPKVCAAAIERGCYNAVITHCSMSEEAYPRSWDSPMFINIYSARCAMVAANLDPEGEVARRLGKPAALEKLASGEWDARELGSLTEAELCPEAGRKEREEVARRLKQKVTEKTSSLFRCPRCKARNQTYRPVQMRSADEPQTIMCTCKECGEEFRGYGG
jgi:DNA-directed RNA polymerase subunit M/transcription elongation factor TFIIS